MNGGTARCPICNSSKTGHWLNNDGLHNNCLNCKHIWFEIHDRFKNTSKLVSPIKNHLNWKDLYGYEE